MQRVRDGDGERDRQRIGDHERMERVVGLHGDGDHERERLVRDGDHERERNQRPERC